MEATSHPWPDRYNIPILQPTPLNTTKTDNAKPAYPIHKHQLCSCHPQTPNNECTIPRPSRNRNLTPGLSSRLPRPASRHVVKQANTFQPQTPRRRRGLGVAKCRLAGLAGQASTEGRGALPPASRESKTGIALRAGEMRSLAGEIEIAFPLGLLPFFFFFFFLFPCLGSWWRLARVMHATYRWSGLGAPFLLLSLWTWDGIGHCSL